MNYKQILESGEENAYKSIKRYDGLLFVLW